MSSNRVALLIARKACPEDGAQTGLVPTGPSKGPVTP